MHVIMIGQSLVFPLIKLRHAYDAAKEYTLGHPISEDYNNQTRERQCRGRRQGCGRVEDDTRGNERD